MPQKNAAKEKQNRQATQQAEAEPKQKRKEQAKQALYIAESKRTNLNIQFVGS